MPGLYSMGVRISKAPPPPISSCGYLLLLSTQCTSILITDLFCSHPHLSTSHYIAHSSKQSWPGRTSVPHLEQGRQREGMVLCTGNQLPRHREVRKYRCFYSSGCWKELYCQIRAAGLVSQLQRQRINVDGNNKQLHPSYNWVEVNVAEVFSFPSFSNGSLLYSWGGGGGQGAWTWVKKLQCRRDIGCHR